MTDRLKWELRRSEIRSRMGELAAVETFTDEQRAELAGLEAEARDVEAKWRAAVKASPEPEQRAVEPGSPENRELRAMLAGASVGTFCDSVVRQSQPDGREAELQAHFGLAGNEFPLEMLRPEYRAVTPAPSDTGAEQEPIVQPVFSEGDAAYLGVSMPTVAAGDAVFPVLTSRPTVAGPHADSTSVADTTGAFTADALAPSRLQAAFFYRATDGARFTGIDMALRMALASGLSEAMDAQVVTRIVTDVARTDASAENTFATYRSSLVYGRLDGRYAPMESDIRLLVGASTATHMSGKYRSNNADDSAIDSLRRIAGGIRVSAHVAAVAASKQDAIVRRGMRMDAVAPMWRNVRIINDEITKAATGEIVLTAVLMAAFKVTRTDGFARVQTQHA